MTCHDGGNWSHSIRDFDPPPVAEPIVDGQFIRFLRLVGMFDLNLFSDGQGNEIRANTVGSNVPAQGSDGFNPPSLLSVFATAPYFHNGSCPTLDCVIVQNPRNSADVHVVAKPPERKDLIDFVRSIDGSTLPFP